MQSSTTPLEVTYLRTTSLKPDPRNPRVHSDKQVRQIAQSIESFGFNVPLLIDDEQKVIAGHGRLLAARKLGWDTVSSGSGMTAWITWMIYRLRMYFSRKSSSIWKLPWHLFETWRSDFQQSEVSLVRTPHR